jgi:inorganic pyrophosphatase
MREQIVHFFHHYKDLEQGKWTRIGQWVDVESTKRLIMEGIERAAKHGS